MAVAVAWVGTCLALRFVIYQTFHRPLTYMIMFPAVIGAALFGGALTGFFAVVLSAMSTILFVPKNYTPTPPGKVDPVNLVIFVITSLVIVYVGAMARRARERAEAAALASTRLASIVASSDDAIMSRTIDGTIDSWNEGAQRMYGYSAEEVLGQNLNILMVPEQQEQEAAVYDRLAKGERVEHFETVRVRKDGTRINVSITTSPIHDAYGNTIGFSKIGRDITPRRIAEQQREKMLETERAARLESERAGKMKDEFLATLSHELRTPLNAISGWAQLLNADSAHEELTQGLEAIQRNAKAQTQIIGDLLDMSRIINGKLRLDVHRLNINTVIEAAIETVRPASRAKEIKITHSQAPGADFLVGDANRLQQVFWNLLTNAIKFTPRGGRASIDCQRTASHFEIVVCDSGSGIPADFLPFVFDRFRQADSSTTRKIGGLGLGLAISRQLVEMHGGTITAKSKCSLGGAEFTVNLPVVSVSAETPYEQDVSNNASSFNKLRADLLQGVKILVVDDEDDARTLLVHTLRSSNAEVEAVGSAEKAIESLRVRPFDVLISDIGMPVEDGFALIKRVRKTLPESVRDIPAIAVTAYARSEDRSRAILSGFQLHLAKPVNPDELIAMAASLTGRAGKVSGESFEETKIDPMR